MLSVAELLDKCHNNKTGCSHECKFSEETLRFSCICPDHLLLDVDTTTCVNPSKFVAVEYNPSMLPARASYSISLCMGHALKCVQMDSVSSQDCC